VSVESDRRAAVEEVVEKFLDWQRDEGDPEATVGVVMIVAEMVNAGGDTSVPVFWCSDGRRWVQSGMLRAVTRAVELPPGG
jgi:hypothetical protein